VRFDEVEPSDFPVLVSSCVRTGAAFFTPSRGGLSGSESESESELVPPSDPGSETFSEEIISVLGRVLPFDDCNFTSESVPEPASKRKA